MTETITALFDNYSDARAAMQDLESAGIPHEDVSIVANDAHGEHGKAMKPAKTPERALASARRSAAWAVSWLASV